MVPPVGKWEYARDLVGQFAVEGEPRLDIFLTRAAAPLLTFEQSDRDDVTGETLYPEFSKWVLVSAAELDTVRASQRAGLSDVDDPVVAGILGRVGGNALLQEVAQAGGGFVAVRARAAAVGRPSQRSTRTSPAWLIW